MSLLEIVTLAIAGWGAVISSYLLFLERRKSQRRLRVELNEIFEPMPKGTSASDGLKSAGVRTAFTLYMGNIGHRDVLPATFGLLIRKGFLRKTDIVLWKKNTYVELREGKSYSENIRAEKFIEEARRFAGRDGKVRLVGYCEDALRGIYKSAPVTSNVTDWFVPQDDER